MVKEKLFKNIKIDEYLNNKTDKIIKEIENELKKIDIKELSKEIYENLIIDKTKDIYIELFFENMKLVNSYQENHSSNSNYRNPHETRVFSIPFEGEKQLLLYNAINTTSSKYENVFSIEDSKLLISISIDDITMSEQTERLMIQEYKETIQYLKNHIDNINKYCQNFIQKFKSKYPILESRLIFDNKLIDKLNNINI